MDKFAEKISGEIRVLGRVRHLLPNDTLITMYNALVLPYFNYCSIVWGVVGKLGRSQDFTTGTHNFANLPPPQHPQVSNLFHVPSLNLLSPSACTGYDVDVSVLT